MYDQLTIQQKLTKINTLSSNLYTYFCMVLEPEKYLEAREEIVNNMNLISDLSNDLKNKIHLILELNNAIKNQLDPEHETHNNE